jgi:hypothetical protein
LQRLKKEVAEWEEKLFRADSAFVEGHIQGDSYTRLKAGYEEQVQALRFERAEIEMQSDGFAEHLTVAVRLLSDLGRIWQRAPLSGKRRY